MILSCSVRETHLFNVHKPLLTAVWTSCNLVALTMTVLNTCPWIRFQLCDSALGKRKSFWKSQRNDGCEGCRDGQILLVLSREGGRCCPSSPSHIPEPLIPCNQAPNSVAHSRSIHEQVTKVVNDIFSQVTNQCQCLWLLPSLRGNWGGQKGLVPPLSPAAVGFHEAWRSDCWGEHPGLPALPSSKLMVLLTLLLPPGLRDATCWASLLWPPSCKAVRESLTLPQVPTCSPDPPWCFLSRMYARTRYSPLRPYWLT